MNHRRVVADRKTETIPALPLTPEHGSWAVLAIPIIVGFGAAGSIGANGLFFAGSALALFLSYVPLQGVLRSRQGRTVAPERLRQSNFWAPALLIAAALLALPLFVDGRWWLLGGGALAAAAFGIHSAATRRLAKTLAGDLAATTGLVLGAPAAYYAVRGILDSRALAIFLLSFLFFGTTVFYVHMRLRASAEKSDAMLIRRRLVLGVPNLLFQLIVVLILLLAVSGRLLPTVAYIALAPMSVHAVFGTLTLGSRSKYRKIGFALLAQSVLFALVAGFLLYA